MSEIWFRIRCWWHGYDPAFVKQVLEADAKVANAGFDDVVGLLKWLDEDEGAQ